MTRPRAGATAQAEKFTYEDYESFPDDGKRYEILDGDLAVTAAPTLSHQRVSRNLVFLLETYLRKHPLGELFDAPVAVVLDEFSVVEPDLVFVSRERAAALGERAIEGAPDLVIEILSPSTRTRDRGAKAKLYARFGVTHYWLVNPEERTLEVRELRRGRYRRVAVHSRDATFAPPLFPGLTIHLAEVWG